MDKKEKEMQIRVQPSLFKRFQNKCSDEYKTVSEVIRELMLKYVKGENEQGKKE